MNRNQWTAKDTRKLLLYWVTGLSSSEIERLMPWFSRNAICGKIKRLRDRFGENKVPSRGTAHRFTCRGIRGE